MKKFKTIASPHHPDIDERFHQLNCGNIGNVVYWREFFRMAAGVPGDVVECGVGRGRSLLILGALNDLLDINEGGGRRIFGYDSFAGFPDPSPQDKSARQPKKGEWSRSPSGKYEYTPEFIRQVLAEAGVDVSKVTLTAGFFETSLLKHPDRPIALLHVDGDLYQSYMSTLEILFPKVVPGGIVVFDDFSVDENPNESFPGARQAVKDFLRDQYKNLKPSIGGTYFYVKTR